MSQFSATLPTLGLEAQGLPLPISSETIVPHSEPYASNAVPSFSSMRSNLNDLKKYYKKLRRNTTLWTIVAILVFLFSCFLVFLYCCKLWDGTNISSWADQITLGQTAFETVKSGQLWTQIPTSTGFGAILWGMVSNIGRLFKKNKQVKWECELCHAGRHPNTLTPAISQSIFSLFGWRINSFWTGFTIAGLAVIAAVYTYVTKGFRHDGSKGWNVVWENLTSKLFTWEDGEAEDKALRVILAVFVFGLAIIFITNPLSRFIIRRSLSVFNTDETNMHPELKEKVFRLNKRDKIISTIILCVLGLGIFIIFKRLIIAVFNRSFNVSRW